MSETQENSILKGEPQPVLIPSKLFVELRTHGEATGRTVSQEATEILELGIKFLELHVRAEKILKEQEGIEL